MINLLAILLGIPAIMVATTIHEFTRAAVSTALGDKIPKEEGRLTLNPIKHFEPIGLIIMLACGFGWGKPVNTSSLYYKNRKLPSFLFLRTRAKSRVTTLFHRQLTLPASLGTAYPDLITGVTRRSLLDFVRCGAPGCIRKRVLRAPLICRLLSVRSVCSYLFPSRLCHSV